jgi:Histidine kinase-, DNA gyrase B-, and HSP90-like ATPase
VTKTLKVRIESDAVEKLVTSDFARGIEELIWNAIDDDAHNINVDFTYNNAGGLTEVRVTDDGNGISFNEASDLFGTIGGSNKKTQKLSVKLGRKLHGQEGKGRYRAFAIGKRICWTSTYIEHAKLQTFDIAIGSLDLTYVTISDPVESAGTNTGCSVTITQINQGATRLDDDVAIQSLLSRLAPTIIEDQSISIRYNGQKLDLKNAIESTVTHKLMQQANHKHAAINAELKIIEWKKKSFGKTVLYWCDENGFCLIETEPKLKSNRFNFSAYVKSQNFRRLHEDDRLLPELDDEARQYNSLCLTQLQDYVRSRIANEASEIIQQMQADQTYPYDTPPRTAVEKAERDVFGICVSTVHEFLPELRNSEKSSQKLTYRLLREALESKPTSLGEIFTEVLRLPKEKQEELADLLKRTSLSSIIQTATTVSDRLAFINGLEQITHDKQFKKHVRERKELHRILANELWIFGDQFNLGTDDATLAKVLQQHRDLLKLAPVPKAGKKSTNHGLSDIPDLSLWRNYYRAGRKDEFEHLVIELKRPRVHISQTEIVQIKRYATTVMNDSNFDKERTRWRFVLIGDDIAADAVDDCNQRNRETGHIAEGTFYDIFVFKWSQIIHEAKVKLQWIQQSLNIRVEDNCEGIEYLRKRYPEYLPSQVVTTVA